MHLTLKRVLECIGWELLQACYAVATVMVIL
jgi:hypothetical protein